MNFIQKKDRAIVFLLPDDLKKSIPKDVLSQVQNEGIHIVEARYSGADDISLSGLSELVYIAGRIRANGKRVELTAPASVVENMKICSMASSFDGVRVG